MLEFPRWKYWLVAVVLLVAAVVALPNVFGEDAALQMVRKDRAAVFSTRSGTLPESVTTSTGNSLILTSFTVGASISEGRLRLASSTLSLTSVFALAKSAPA